MKTRKKRQKKVDLLSALLQAVSARYDDAGDKTKAGVVLSCIGVNGEKSTWYGSVVRYPDGPDVKVIVCKTTHVGTFDGCVARLAADWRARCVVDPGVRVTQQLLDRALDPLRKAAEARTAKAARALATKQKRDAARVAKYRV